MSATEKALVFLILAVVVALLYGPALFNGFVWDDHLHIVRNDFVQDWAHFPQLFSKSYLTPTASFDELGHKPIGSGEVTYRPVVTASYFFLFSWFGLDPAGYHAANLLLHALNAFLFFLFCLRLGLRKTGAALAAFLFAGHPVNAEAVQCISYNENMLCFAFLFAGLLVYTAPEKIPGPGRTAGAAFLFLLSMFTKETGLVFLPAVFLYYRIFRPAHAKRAASYGILASAAVFYGWVRFSLFSIPGSWLFVRDGIPWTIPK